MVKKQWITMLRLGAAPAILAMGAMMPTVAAAQEVPSATDGAGDDQVIIVTGSRIAHKGYDTAEPTIVVGSEQMEARGLTNIGDALSMIPAFGPAANNPVGGQAGDFGSGQTFVDFFGLGSQRTLTLVNGRRYVSSNTASIFGPVDAGSQVDLNTIPTLLVDRVETVAVGGAPIYGSDAIAGTVNIILKDKFDGLKLDAQYGLSSRADASNYRLGALAGTSFGDGRGHIVAAFEYNKSQGLTYSDRSRTARGLYFARPADSDYPYSFELIENRRLPVLSEYGAPTVADILPGFGADITDSAGNTLVFNARGELVPLDFGTPTGSVTNSSGGNGFSLVPTSNLLSPTERYLGNVQLNYELTDHIQAFSEFSYSRSKGTELRAQPVYNTWLFDDAGTPDGNLVIPLSNPFLSDAARATISKSLDFNGDGTPDQDYFYLGRANTDITSGLASSTVELYRIVAGLKGDFTVGGRGFTWEVVGNYGHSKTRGSSRGLVQQNFEKALAGCPTSMADSPIATVGSTCVPFNPFGHQNSQAVADYLTTVAHPVAKNEQWVVTASTTGSLFNIWGGEVSVVLGYEHRQEKADFDPGEFYYGIPDPTDPAGARTSYGRSTPIDPVHGKYNTDEIFGELLVPVVSPDMNIPLIHMLEAHGAARYVHNSLNGGDTTWTLGGRWKPVADLTIRGNYTRSIRSPAVTELFNPTSQIFTTADDPCDSRYINSGPNPSVRQANCAAAGLPADFTSNIVDYTAKGSLSGNVNLQNEKADSWTIGAVLAPRALRGFQLAVDWVSISLKDAILSVDADQTMAACYDANSFPSAACGQIDRDANGQVEFIRTGYLNAASYKYKGLIGSMSYAFRTPFLGADSRMSLNANYQYIDTLEQRVGMGDLDKLAGGLGYSRHQATGSVSYSNGAFGAYVQARYIGSAKIDPNAAAGTYENPKVDSVIFTNAALSLNINDRYTMRFIVDNVFDKSAPYPVPAGGSRGLVTYFDGIIGRTFKVGISTRF